MGDLQRFLTGDTEKKAAYRTGGNVIPFNWLALLLFAGGAVWMFIAWGQVRRAHAEKEKVMQEIAALSEERDRLQSGHFVQQTGWPDDEQDPESNSLEGTALKATEAQAVSAEPAATEVLFLVIAGASKTLSGADIEVGRLRQAGVPKIMVYLKDQYYRIVAGPFLREEAAPQLETVKAKVNATAYLLRSDQWCEAPLTREGYYECEE